MDKNIYSYIYIMYVLIIKQFGVRTENYGLNNNNKITDYF